MPGAWSTTMRLDGGKELNRRLGRLSEALQKKVLRKAVRKPGRLIANAARRKIRHEETGLLKKSLGVYVKLYKGSWTAVAIVGPRKSVIGSKGEVYPSRRSNKVWPVKYAHLVEGGTKPHDNPPFQRWGTGKWVHMPRGRHPGAKPKPFMEPAFDENHRRASDLLRATLRKELDALPRKVR
jgi:HK97 gp10 family phage protein